MSENRSRVLRGCLYAGLGGVCWGLSGTCGQYLFSHYPINSLWLTCVRMLSAGLILLVIALTKNSTEVKRLLRSPKDLVLTDAEKALILEAVNNTIKNPFTITQSQITEG